MMVMESPHSCNRTRRHGVRTHDPALAILQVGRRVGHALAGFTTTLLLPAPLPLDYDGSMSRSAANTVRK